MATPKTECSELSVAFGLLGYNEPVKTAFPEVASKFEGSLSEAKFKSFVSTYPSDDLYASMNSSGIRLRNNFRLFNDLNRIRWTGGDRQARTMSTAKDLLAVNVPISVKAESRVVGNPSPYNLFVATPQGSAQAQGMSSWYLEMAGDAYQEFYAFSRSALGLEALPETVSEFEASNRKRLLIRSLANLSEQHESEFQDLYLKLCRRVSQTSAEIFNDNLSKSLNSRIRSTVLERVAKMFFRMFFRMNAVEYVLCGIDGRAEFAVVIPDLTTWLRTWQFDRITALPNLQKEQSIVDFEILCRNKTTKETYLAKFHAEIRWSHGKFSSVEGKLYKEFDWIDLPFFDRVF